MKTSKLLITSLLAAAAMSATAFGVELSGTADGTGAVSGATLNASTKTYSITLNQDGNTVGVLSIEGDYTVYVAKDAWCIFDIGSAANLTGTGTLQINRINTGGWHSLTKITSDTNFAGTIKISTSGNSTNHTVNLSASAASATLNLANSGIAARVAETNVSIAGLDGVAGSKIVSKAALGDTTGGNGNSSAFSDAINDATVRTLTLSGSGTYGFSGTVGSTTNQSSLNLTKSGTGTQTLSGTTYLGNLDVSGGELVLSGTANIAGTTTVGAGGKLNLSGARVSLANEIQNSGTVTISDATVFNLTQTGVTMLITGSGAIDGFDWNRLTSSNFTYYGVGLDTMRSASVGVSTAGAVTLSYSAAGLTWAGTSNNSTWNTTKTNTNWTNETSADSFYNYDNVTFGADAEVKTVTLENGANLAVGTMTVTGNSSYTFTMPASGNSATVSGASLTVDSGSTLVVGQGGGGTKHDINLRFDEIKLGGTLEVKTAKEDSWSKLTFTNENATLVLTELAEETSGNPYLSIGTVQMDAAGKITQSYSGPVSVGALTGSGNLTISSSTVADQWGHNTVFTFGDLTGYSGTLTLDGSTLPTSGGYKYPLSASIAAANIGTTAKINVGANTTLSVTASASGAVALDNVSGAGTLKFAAVGNTTDSGGNNPDFSTISLGTGFTGTVEITSGIVDMLTGDETSAISSERLGNASKVVLNGGGLLFRNVNNTTLTGMGTFDKAIEVGANGGVIRVYGNGNVTVASDISGTGMLKHSDGGTLTLAGTVTLTGFRVGANSGTTQIAGTAQFSSVSFGSTNSVLKVIGGGTLTLAGHDALGYSSGGLDSTGKIILQGSSASSIAKLVIADTESMTLSKEIQLNGYAEISNATGSKFNSWYGKITASGTNNVISSVIDLGKSFTVSVAESGALEISGSISDRTDDGEDGRKLIKEGLGELTLSGSNSFANGVTVSGGKLIVKNVNALGASTGTTTVAADASLVVISGVTITNAGTISLSENAKLVVDMTGQTAGTEEIVLTLISNTALKYNENAFDSDCTSLLGSVVVLENLNETLSAWTQSLSYANDTLSLTLTIPEPSQFGLLAGLAALALAGTRRRRKKA